MNNQISYKKNTNRYKNLSSSETAYILFSKKIIIFFIKSFYIGLAFEFIIFPISLKIK